MNTFGEKVMRAPCAASRRAAACAMSSASGASSSASTSAGRSTVGSTVGGHDREATRPRQDATGFRRTAAGEVLDAASPPEAPRTPPTGERGVGHLPAVGDEPLPVDRRELVEVAAPVVEAVHGQEQVVRARLGVRLAQHVDLRGRGVVTDERHPPARDPLLGRGQHDRLAPRRRPGRAGPASTTDDMNVWIASRPS